MAANPAPDAAAIHEKLRSKHIRTLEALAQMVAQNRTLQQRVAELQQALDLSNARAAVPDADAVAAAELLRGQVSSLDADNQRLTAELAETQTVAAKHREEDQRALKKLRAERLAMAREASEAKAESAQLREENEAVREEAMDLRGKAQRAWEFEVSSRELTLEVAELKKEIERLRAEDAKQRAAYVASLSKAESEGAEAAAEKATAAVAAAVQQCNAAWAARVAQEDMAGQLTAEKRHTHALAEQLARAEAEITALKQAAAEQAAAQAQMKAPAVLAPTSPKSPRALAVPDAEMSRRLAELEAMYTTAKDHIDRLENELAALRKATPEDGEKGFGAFIDVKRENQLLRMQIKDLMLRQQQRSLVAANRVNRVVPGGRGGGRYRR